MLSLLLVAALLAGERGVDLTPRSGDARLLVLRDGSALPVRSYREAGALVVAEDLAGELVSIRRERVDLAASGSRWTPPPPPAWRPLGITAAELPEPGADPVSPLSRPTSSTETAPSVPASAGVTLPSWALCGAAVYCFAAAPGVAPVCILR